MFRNTRSGFTTRRMKNMAPSRTSSSWPYSMKISGPFSATEVYTRPRMPNGAQAMIQRTTIETTCDMSPKNFLVPSLV